MLSCFGDESSDETKQRVFAVAGLIGTDEMWTRLETAWVIRTEGVPFHANDCESDHGDYKNSPHERNQTLYRDLVGMLAHSGLCGFGFAVDFISQKVVFPASPHASNLAYYRGFSEVLESMTRFGDAYDETVRFVFDSRQESEYNAGFLYDMFRRREESNRLFRNITFAFSRDEPKVQVADLMARETMKALDNQIGPVRRPPRKSWMALYGTERFKIDAIGKIWFESLRDQIRSLEQDAGVDQENYNAWLERYKLQHSLTTAFRFIDWTAKRRSGGI